MQYPLVVRLKGGDPYVFGRGGEEALGLEEKGVPFEVIPGISSAIAGPACAGIPVTHRGIADGFHVVTAHNKKDELADIDFAAMAGQDDTCIFLMGLGKGFAFVGREYTIPIEGTEEKIDLLFYHLYLHCYVVVEVKIVAFTSRDIGQIGTYVNIVDDLVKTDFDAKTIGLIICKSKNNILAKYAVNSSKEPIGISEYKLSNLLPVEYRASMPTIEEIENELR